MIDKNYLKSVRKKLTKQGISEEDIDKQLNVLTEKAKEEEERRNSPVVPLSDLKNLKKENKLLAAENHDLKEELRNLHREFKLLQVEKNNDKNTSMDNDEIKKGLPEEKVAVDSDGPADTDLENEDVETDKEVTGTLKEE